MSRFDKHFKMNEQDSIDYAKEKLSFFDSNAKLSSKEIGDGNINYVFRIIDENTNKSLILKHADTAARSTAQYLDTDHNRIETEILKLEGELAPGLVPEVYFYDPIMCCVAMEDLRDFENMRYALIAHKTFRTFADDITTFMANTLIKTTDSVLTPKKKKELTKRYINPDLCDITERLVYTDPYTNESGRNILTQGNEEFLKKELYEDEALLLEVAKMKEVFKSKAQSLIHGDLHTGSIFVREDKAMVLDPEFAFYGPAGYDIGNVIANLIFAWANAEVTMDHQAEKEKFQKWIEASVTDVINLFKKKALAILAEETTDRMARVAGFSEWLVSDMLCDTAGVAGAELHRRIIGSAKVKDIAGIENKEKRALAEKVCVLCGKNFIMNRNVALQTGEEYVEVIKSVRASL